MREINGLEWLEKEVQRCLKSTYGEQKEIKERFSYNKRATIEHIEEMKKIIETTGLLCVKVERTFKSIIYHVANISSQAPDPNGYRSEDINALIDALRTILSLLKHRVSDGHKAILSWDELRPYGRYFPYRMRKQLINGLEQHGIPTKEVEDGIAMDADYETIRKIESYAQTYSKNATPGQYLIAQKTSK